MWEIYRPTIVTVPLHCSHSALLWLPFTAADAARLRWSFALLRLGKLKASRVITVCQAPCDALLCPARQLSELQIFECAQSTEIRHKPFFIKYPEGSLITEGRPNIEQSDGRMGLPWQVSGSSTAPTTTVSLSSQLISRTGTSDINTIQSAVRSGTARWWWTVCSGEIRR